MREGEKKNTELKDEKVGEGGQIQCSAHDDKVGKEGSQC